MAFISEVLGLMANTPIVYNTVLNFFGKVEFRQDLCLKVHRFDMYSNTPDRLLATFLWKLSVLENHETKLLKQLVKPGMRVVDIGANIGYYTLLLSHLVGRTGTIIAFEPDPNNFRLLLKNVARNRLCNIAAIQKAVSNQCGKSQLFLNKGHRGDHRLFDHGGNRPFLEIETITLDEYLSGNSVDIIKIDIQGAELMALQGMRETLVLNPDVLILTEFSPYHLEKAGANPEEMLDNILTAGFFLQMIDENSKSVRPISKIALLSRCTGKKYENLYLTRKW